MLGYFLCSKAQMLSPADFAATYSAILLGKSSISNDDTTSGHRPGPAGIVRTSGRGSPEHDERLRVKQLRKDAAKGKANQTNMAWYHDKSPQGMDARLRELTEHNRAGDCWDQDGKRMTVPRHSFTRYLRNHSEKLQAYTSEAHQKQRPGHVTW